MTRTAIGPGDNIDARFEIEQQVAAGGMGRIYRARDRLTGQPVAVKLLDSPHPHARERFLTEAVVLAEIQHPGIVRYVSHGLTTMGDPYLVMEWLEGEDLARYLGRLRRQAAAGAGSQPRITAPPAATDRDSTQFTRPASESQVPTAIMKPPTPVSRPQPAARVQSAVALPVEQVLHLGLRLASAVAELHRRGIIHRDIKPGNLFLRGGMLEHVKLLDFGTVRHHIASEGFTEPGRLVGTPHYMAPEQVRAESAITPATDVWAIGCVLYECLTGIKAFSGDDMLVVFARIVVEEPAPIRSLRPEVPEDFVLLIERMLSKSASDRPADAGVLNGALNLLSTSRPLVSVAGAPVLDQTLPGTITLTTAETRITSMLFARDPHPGRRKDDSLAIAVAGAGGVLHQLAGNTLLVTIPDPNAPTDQAARAARAGLALRAAAPELAAVIATGRAEGPNQVPLSDVVLQAAGQLENVAPGMIRLDDLTASLLDPRFHLGRDEHGPYLESERQHEATRTLLGKPTRWVGRQRELAMLIAIFDECVSEDVARAVLVTASAGMGKSRLRYELEQTLRRRGEHFEVLRGQGDVVSAGSPFVMLAPAIRRLAGIRDGEPLEDRRRKLRDRLAETVAPAELERITVFLGEMIGVPFPDDNPSLRAARKAPLLLSELMLAAWVDWLRAECSHRPVLLILEDLHWGDRPTIQYVDGALRSLQRAPFMVLALARPEVHTAFPQLWAQRELFELPLYALSDKACLSLIRDVLGPAVPDAVANAMIQRAGGNAFYLEELIRAVAEEGAHQLPETILGMVQSRLDALGIDAKRILRAGSIFGEVFWQGGVEALLGSSGVYDVSEWLDDLVAREVISRQPESRVPGDTEYKFRHALVRDGAYAMLTEEDRRLGHALAGAWLEHAGEQDGLVLAEHFMRGGDPERAIPCFQRAAAQALEGNDLAAVISRAERGVQAGAEGAMLGALRALQSVAGYWLSNYVDALEHGSEAAALLPTGSAEWFVAVGNAIVSSARLGDYDRLDELFVLATDARCAAGAEAEQLICLSRGTLQLIFHGRIALADEILQKIAALASAAQELDALTRAQVHHVQGVRAGHAADISTLVHHQQIAVEAFESAGDRRNVALESTTLAWCWAELGYFEHAAQLCEHNLARCLQGDAQQAITYAKVNLGYILSYCAGRLGEAHRFLLEAIAECRAVGNSRLEGWGRAFLTWLLHQQGDHETEEREARTAVELLAVSPGLQSWALAAHARALLALSQPEQALTQARAAMDILDRLGGILQGTSLPPLILARALHALGDHAGAQQAIADAAARLDARAARIAHPEWRAHFLAIPENALTLELCSAWGARAS